MELATVKQGQLIGDRIRQTLERVYPFRPRDTSLTQSSLGS